MNGSQLAAGSRISRRLAAITAAAALAAAVGMAAAPGDAHADESLSTGINRGGLVFTAASGAGVTETIISEVNGDGVVTVTGTADIVVTQTQVGQGQTAAVAVQLGVTAGEAYTGTITFNNVNIDGKGTTGQPTIEFERTMASSSVTKNAGATVILNNCTIGSTDGPAISMGNTANSGNYIAEDALSIEGGTTVTAEAGQVGIVVNKTANSTTKDPIVIQFANGGGTVTGGSYDPDTQPNQGAITIKGITTINVNDDATVTGANGSTVSGFSCTSGQGITVFGDPSAVQATIQGESTLTVSGGDGSNTSEDSADGNAAIVTNNGVITLNGPGTVNALGGSGANVNDNGANNPGGSGSAISVGSQTSNTPSLIVNGGTLNAIGGNGCETNQTYSGGGSGITSATTIFNGGHGIALNGGSSAYSVMQVSGGVVNATGGNGGVLKNASPFQYAPAGYGIHGYDATGENYLIINQGSASAPAPVVTAQGGIGGVLNTTSNGYTTVADTFADAIANVGDDGSSQSDGSNIDIQTPIAGSANRYGNWHWIAISESASNGKLVEPAVLQGFAGMDANQKGTMQSALVGNPWVQVTTGELESVNANVIKLDTNGTNPATTQPGYVQAQTTRTMTGNMPNSNYIYAPTIAATFQGFDLNTVNFGTLAGFDVDAENTTIEPAANVSNVGMTATAAGAFYVVPAATGNTLTVTPAPNQKLPKTLTNMYGTGITIDNGVVPVVYTVYVSQPTKLGDPAITMTGTAAFTNPDGSGTLVESDNSTPAAPASPVTPLDQIVANDADEGIVAAVDYTIPAGNNNQFLGLFTESTTPYGQVSNTQIDGWNSNAYLTAEFGELTLTGVLPSPTNVNQGESTSVNATYRVAPLNDRITSYDFDLTGLEIPWQAMYVNVQTGNAPANGMTVAYTGSTVSGENPFLLTVTAEVAVDYTADLGHYRVWPTPNTGTPGAANASGFYSIVIVGEGSEAPAGEIDVVRMYNPWTLEHLYTTDAAEVSRLEAAGWDNENTAWVSPQSSAYPIYRLYNPFNGDHLYTRSLDEYNELIGWSWQGEDVAFYGADDDMTPIYRLYNPWMTENGGAFSHLWTASFTEYTDLGTAGWQQESVAWYATSAPQPAE